MVSLRLYVNVVVRVLLLAANCMIFAFTYYGSGKYFTLFNLGLLIVIQILLFIHYVNITNRDLAYFFDSIKNEDSGISFNRTKQKFQNIYKLMDNVNDQMKAIRIKYATQDQYFKTILENIQTGLISFWSDGKVDIINKAAKRMLGINTLNKIDALNKLEKGMGDTLHDSNPLEKKLICMKKGSETVHLSINSTTLKTRDKELKIITFHDIRNELDKKELESWQKLIRILNHEMMNSLAPIISTASTLKNYLSLQNTADNAISDQQWNRVLEKTISGLSIIYERSEGLKSFVEHYKTLNSLPQPAIATFVIEELFNNCKLLLNEELKACRIDCIVEMAVPHMELAADKSQIQQVLLNLLKNSIESLSETEIKNRIIRLKALYNESGKTVLQVSDNGKGIPPEIIDQIFVPFFTTKEKGSGIGLSLSKQILLLHNGTIAGYSVPDHETVFSITF